MLRKILCPVCDRFNCYASGILIKKCECGQVIVSEPSPEDETISKDQAVSQFKRKRKSKAE